MSIFSSPSSSAYATNFASMVMRETYERSLNRFCEAFFAYFTPLVSKGQKGFVKHTFAHIEPIVLASRDTDHVEALRLLKRGPLPRDVLTNRDRKKVIGSIRQTRQRLNQFLKDATECELAIHRERKAFIRGVIQREGGIDLELADDEYNY